VRSWWADADERAYRLRTRQLVEALNAIVLTGGGHHDGDLLAPESLGDLAGLTIAYRAYQRSLGGTRAPVLDGFTGDQRFFLGWAQVWRSKVRPEYEREQAGTSRYPPADVRANLPLGHLPAFVEAFGVQPGDALYRAPGDRARIW
jgi:endothelin-converting enzyme/putative endopeptidase